MSEGRADPAVPPGWPAQVRPPGAPDWQHSATGWLLDLCPPEYRGYPVLRSHPVALAWLAGYHVRGQADASRRALAAARAQLRGDLAADTVEAVVAACEREPARLAASARAVDLVTEALRGHAFVPRL